MVDDENDLQLELLDIFGIDTQEAKEKNEYKVNQPLKFHDMIEQRIKDQISSMYDPGNFINADE